MKPNLKWTGHPFADVGVATLLAMSGKTNPIDLTSDDLHAAATTMKGYYFSGLLSNYLTCVFMNSEYVQPGGGTAKAAKREEYSKQVLFAFERQPDLTMSGIRCVFSGEPALQCIHRGQMPMLTGEDVLNFFPNASGGLPIAGPFLTAIQSLPLGGRRCEGKLLLVHSDRPEITKWFAERYYKENQRFLALAAAGQLPQGKDAIPALLRGVPAEGKFPGAKSPASLLMNDLQELISASSNIMDDAPIFSLLAYWCSSSGQGPQLEIFHFPSQLIGFLKKLQSPGHRPAWNALMSKGWVPPNPKKNAPPPVTGPGRSNNYVLTDLLNIFDSQGVLYEKALRFIGRNFLRPYTRKTNPIRASEDHWPLIELFLKELLGMLQTQIEQIRTFADALATYIHASHDKSLLTDLLLRRKYSDISNALCKAQTRAARNKSSPQLLFSFADFVNVFEADASVGFFDFRIARDLITIRLIETLYQMKSPVLNAALQDEKLDELLETSEKD